MWGIVLVISTMPHFITTHSINNPNYIKMQQNKNQQLDAKFRKFIKVLIMAQIQNFGFEPHFQELNVSDTTHKGCRYRQHTRLAKGDEPLVCHSGHSAPDRA